MTNFKKAEITRINSNGDLPWFVSSGAIEARFRDHADAIHFAHAHATMRADHRAEEMAAAPARIFTAGPAHHGVIEPNGRITWGTVPWRTGRAEYHAHKRRWQALRDAINGTSRTQP